ncbi:MAG TPA: hypothetical protein VFX51_22330 [Solirubrobacteraceae bacterium]|nr:hypothetical protein [Solirubrobacteraceae bacterium]
MPEEGLEPPTRDSFKEKGGNAWRHAKLHPVTSGIVTIGGLAAAVAVGWAVSYYELIDRAKTAIGA